MARQFLTGLNLNKNELLNAKIQNLTTSEIAGISSPTAGQLVFDTDLHQLKVYSGSAWLALAAGGNVQEAIDTAINALDTDDIEEGSSNLYYTESRAKTDAAELLTGATKTNITITGDGSGLTITAENGVADSDTDDLTEGSTNLYYTDGRARDALSGGTGISYNSSTGEIAVDRTATDTWYDAAGAASDVADDLSTHINDTSAHGVAGVVVGTSDSQTLTNKTLGTGTVLSASVDADGYTITDLGTPSADTDAATKGYVDTGISTHASDTSTHGVGEIVGTTESQTLTNKTLGSGTVLSADLNADSNKIINVATPVAGTDAANKDYVDAVAEGLHVKEGVDAATTNTLASLSGGTVTYDNGTAGVGATLTLANALTTLDGHALANGDRVLIKNEAEPAHNGIYIRTSSTVFTRDPLFDSDEEIEGGDFVFVVEGTVNASTGWVQSSTVNVVGTDDMVWIQFSGAGTYLAGNGLTLTGTTFDVVGTSDRITVSSDSIDIASTYVGQSSITTLGTITTGTWNGTDIAVADGGTGSSTAAGARANLGATTKYTEANPELTVSSGEVTWTVTHNLGIRTVVVQVFDTVNFDQVEVDVERTNTSTVTLQWPASATVDAGAYQVVIVG